MNISMSISMSISISIAALFLLALPASAADNEGNFMVLSLGNQSCSKVVAAYPTNGWDKLSFSVWLGGYFSAINEHVFRGSNIAADAEPPTRDLWVYNYCKKNPGDKLGKAASALYRDLLSR
jgi:hypothetical protein